MNEADVYSSFYRHNYNLLNVFCTRNIRTCILDHAGHVIIGLPCQPVKLGWHF